MSGPRAVLLLLVLASAMVGCAKAQARTEPVPPEELLPPPAPPRMVEQYQDELEPAATVGPSETALDTTPARVMPKPPMPKPDATAKPEPARTEPERPTPPPPSLTLKPAPGAQSTTEASIRDLLGRANRDLGRVSYTSLTGDGKAQYDTARRFIQQGEDALRAGNLVFAGKVADKAATIANSLVQ